MISRRGPGRPRSERAQFGVWQVAVQFTMPELNKLDRLCELTGKSRAGLIRSWVGEVYQATYGKEAQGGQGGEGE